jgi:hypothetical protein
VHGIASGFYFLERSNHHNPTRKVKYPAKGEKIMSANTNIKQVVIVTGVSSGIGLCIPKRFSNTAIVSSQIRADCYQSIDDTIV